MTKRPGTKLEDAWGELGELLDRRSGEYDRAELVAYRDDPVDFSREVLGGEPWTVQETVMRAVVEHDRVVWRGSNALGKDWTAAAVALYWVYCQRGRVLLTGPTARQVREVVMRNELAKAKRRADLPGDLYATALRLPGEEESKIVAATSSEPGGLQGLHAAGGVLAILTEAQDCDEWVWEAAASCTAGEHGRTLAVGNPLRPSGPFYAFSRPGSGWHTVQTSAFEHPNLDPESDRWIPGGPSEGWVERMREDYGETSPIWTARVEGDFPQEAVHGLFRRSWLEDAAERHESGALDEEARGAPLVAALDPSRHGPDASVLAVKRGPVVVDLKEWAGRVDTGELARRVREALESFGILPRGHTEGPAGHLVVDEAGVGGGVLDRLREMGLRAHGFNGGRSAEEDERYCNRRAETFWRLRDRLERGKVALPRDEQLFEELLALEYTIASRNRVQLEAKAEAKSRLGRSPDRADAVAMLEAAPELVVDPRAQPITAGGYTAEELREAGMLEDDRDWTDIGRVFPISPRHQ